LFAVPHIIAQGEDSSDGLQRANITLEVDRLVVVSAACMAYASQSHPFQTLLSAAQEYRSENAIRYGISPFSSPVPVWTESKDNIRLLLVLNDKTLEDCRAVHQLNLDNLPSHMSREQIEGLQEQLKYHLLYVSEAYFRVVRNCLAYLHR
jgi:hypothetical protein